MDIVFLLLRLFFPCDRRLIISKIQETSGTDRAVLAVIDLDRLFAVVKPNRVYRIFITSFPATNGVETDGSMDQRVNRADRWEFFLFEIAV